MACQPQIRLEMLVSEKVITVTRIKCMYNFTFRQLWFLAEPRRRRNRCFSFADTPTRCVQQVGPEVWVRQWLQGAHVLGEASCKCKPRGSLGAPKSSSLSPTLCSGDQKDCGALLFQTRGKLAKRRSRNNKRTPSLPPQSLLQEVLPSFLVLRGKI